MLAWCGLFIKCYGSEFVIQKVDLISDLTCTAKMVAFIKINNN